MNKNIEILKKTFLTALKNYKKKNFKTAEIYCYKILSIDSNHFDSLSLLATIAAVNTDFNKAKELLFKAVAVQPENVSALHNLATTYKELGNLKESASYYKKVLQIQPNHINAHYNLGLVFHKLNDLRTAKNYLKKTTELQNNFALAFFSLANVYNELKEYNDAISCYQKTIELNTNIVAAHNNLGLVFRSLNDFKSAVSSYQNAIKINPKHAGAHHNLAITLKEGGYFDKAIESHLLAIKYEPENLAHYHFISELKEDILTQELKNKILTIFKNKEIRDINSAYGNYLLAKYERKEKNYKQEINWLIKGHKNFFNSRRKKFELGVKYCFDDVLKISDGVQVKNIDKKKYEELKPIFIIGVPRSGSTLVEKIIGSGTQPISIGEETAVFENYINKKILENTSLILGDVKDIRNDLYEIYNQRGILLKNHNYIFTDKSLNNFFYIELIKEIYPNAKIINCNRNPLSSIMSIFQNNLTDLAWAHDLSNIFKYFDNYFEIIENYNSVNTNVLYQLNFEKLANDPEKESKKLMEYCELPWDKKCLEFYKRKDLISKTASNIQIRKAVYKHQVEKYLPYKEILEVYAKNYSWFK